MVVCKVPFFSVVVPSNYANNLRLDTYIASIPGGMNRSKLKSGISEIMVNGKRSKLSFRVHAGDRIDIDWEDNIPDNIEPEDIPLSIIYEDKNVTVINKVQGMVTHPAAGNWHGTLVNALLFHWGYNALPQNRTGSTSEILAARRPGIVHRLDKDTSGIIITARNRKTEEWLQEQFQKHYVKKEYIAVVCGRPPHANGDIRTKIVRDPSDRKRYKAVSWETEKGKAARTLYHCIACYGNYSLMRLRLKTGRTHQIRVHMKYIGCPILGDPIYNSKTDHLFNTATLMLHARFLQIRLPGKNIYDTFKAEIPVRFKNILMILHKKYSKEILK